MKRSLVFSALAVAMIGNAPAQAQGLSGFLDRIGSAIRGDTETRRLRAAIWVDPDGCEHWVMDDGLEGFMSAHLDKAGKPVCRGKPATNGVCKTFEAAALFAVGSAVINPDAKDELNDYFATVVGKTVFVNGHTDSNGSDESNLDLSLRRAMAVSDLALAAGVNAEPRGFGENVPIADNATSAGRAKNRRVELTCS